MSRILTFVGIGIVITVAVYMRRLALQALGPGTTFFELAASSQIGDAGGQDWAMAMFEAMTVWVPWLLVAAAILGGLYLEFTRTNVTQGVRR